MLSSSSSQKAKGGGESWLLLRRGALNRLSLESATTGKALSVNDMTPSLLSKPKLLPWRRQNMLAQEMRFPCLSISISKLTHTVKGIITFQV